MGDNSISGTLLEIERCALHDGPGIRTAVFLKGCPLRCQWCHNPESQLASPQLAVYTEKCNGCGICVRACPHNALRLEDGHCAPDRTRCAACGLCATQCPNGALKRYGETQTVAQVMETVCRDRAYYAGGGGLTVSGGEPFAQPGFTLALLRAAREQGIHTCVETCGQVSRAILEEAAPLADCFLFDYKLTDPKAHRRFTGVDNRLILDNLHLLYALGRPIILRCPIIPGINDVEGHFEGIAAMETAYPALMKVEIMPYHDMGRGKAEAIGGEYTVAASTAGTAEKERWKAQMDACGCSRAAIGSF